MATITRIRRVANPKRHYKPRNAKGRFMKRKAKANAHRRRSYKPAKAKRAKSNPVRIRTYSVKTLKKELRRRGVKLQRTVVKTRRAHRKSNPILIEMGTLNPHKRRTSVKKSHRKRSNPSRRRRHATAVRHHRKSHASVAHRRRTRHYATNPRRRRNRRVVYRRNPAIFGQSSGKALLMMTGGILVGVAATKYIPTILPTQLTSIGGGSPIVGVVITGAAAFAAGYIAKMVVKDHAFSDAVLLGGLAQTASQLLNVIAPAALSSRLALSGVGDITPGNFVVPQNPLRPAPVAVMPKTTGMGAFRGAFGGRR